MFVLAHAVLPRLVPELRRSLPKVDLEFIELSASTREARLLDHSVTVALCMPAIRHSEIEVSTIGKQRLMLAMPAGSQLARAAAVPVRKHQGRPLIDLPGPAEDPANSVVMSLLRRHQISMPVANRVETAHSALSLVLAGEGMAILPPAPGSDARPASCSGRSSTPTMPSTSRPAWRRDSLNPLVRNFHRDARKR